MASKGALKWFCLGLASAVTCLPQSPPDTLSGLQQNAEGRSAEWTTLAMNLEQRVTRLLPCDARIRGAIEETNRASEARISALNTYWMALAVRSRSQEDAMRRLLEQEESRKPQWSAERVHAGEIRAAVTDQSALLDASVNRLPALGDAQKSLSAAVQALLKIQTQAEARESSAEQLLTELRDALAANRALQSGVDAHVKALATEGTHWRAYYEARLKRAQMECTITNPGAEKSNPAPPPRRRKKK